MRFLPKFTLALLLLLCAGLTRGPLAYAQENPVLPEAHVTYTTIDVPGAGVTNVLGINSAGDMVGNYATAYNTPSSGFLYSGGTFALFDYPGGDSTLATGINDSGLIVGYAYLQQGTAAASFLYNGTSFTTIRSAGDAYTIADGLNNTGDIVGGRGSDGGNQGFELIGTKFKDITPPGTYILVYATGINNLGEIVGWTSGEYGGAFLYKKGKFRTISISGSSQTEALGINDSGLIVGWYSPDSAYIYAFAYLGGKYVSLSYPGALYTFADGINKNGQIVGAYTFDGQTYYGFVTSPIAAADFEERPGCCIVTEGEGVAKN